MSAAGISPDALFDLLLGSGELALLDVREARWFNASHLNLARLAPLSSLELLIAAFVPRPDTPVVVYDADDVDGGPAAEAAGLLGRLGYTDVRRLEGGLLAWAEQGLPVIDGYNTLVKAFGDEVRRHYGTPVLPLAELQARQREGRPVTLVDARPAEEYAFLSIAGARNYPGTELALRRFPDAGPDHVWGINCFSRTRGIIGTTTLRLLERAPGAAFVEDGVMAWGLHGGPVVQNAQAVDDIPAEEPAILHALADRLVLRHALERVDAQGVERLRADAGRTLYLFDVRPVSGPEVPTFTDAGEVRHVPGGQLLMHFENLVGTRHARIVLIDHAHQLRAAITAFWLRQLNQAEVFILDGALPTLPALIGAEEDGTRKLDPDRLAELLALDQAVAVDVGPSLDYERGHVPGAFYLLPSSLRPLEALLPSESAIVFVSPNGAAARIAARDARRRWPEAEVHWLDGGMKAWKARGHPVEFAFQHRQLLTPFDDDWGSVMRVFGPRRDAVWADYLAWERGLSARVADDPTVSFRFFPT